MVQNTFFAREPVKEYWEHEIQHRLLINGDIGTDAAEQERRSSPLVVGPVLLSLSQRSYDM